MSWSESALLLDSSLPVIRRRTAALSAELARNEQLEQAGAIGPQRTGPEPRRADREKDPIRPARSARAAKRRAERRGGGRRRRCRDCHKRGCRTDPGRGARPAIRSPGRVPSLQRSAQCPAGRIHRAARPRTEPWPIACPSMRRVVEGLGEVNASGVRSRGLTLATSRGTAVTVPASGIIRFSGPFRDYDGIVIIDHGGGWMSLIVNVASQLRPGTRVRAATPLGRAMGPLGVELSRNGQHLSPALIAGSSTTLSNKGKGG